MRKPDQSSNAGYPAGAANRGRLFFGYFILAKQKKVTSCRSTTGGVDFVFDVGLRDEAANPTYELIDSPPLRGDPSTGSGRTVYIYLKRCQCLVSANRSVSQTPTSALSATPLAE
jgi:hypothetical protein